MTFFRWWQAHVTIHSVGLYEAFIVLSNHRIPHSHDAERGEEAPAPTAQKCLSCVTGTAVR